MALPWNKRALAIISPKSGKGKAQKMFMDIEPALKAYGFQIDTILTDKKAHATDILLDMAPEKFKTYFVIMIFGGDGVVTEAINGFYQKGIDVIKEHNLILRVAPLLGGTANAMGFYSAQQYGLKKSLWNLVWVLTRQKFEDLSVFNLQIASDVDNYKSSQNIRGWHSLMFGSGGDIMEKSEAYRCLGGCRYTFATLKVLCCNRKSRNVKFWWSEDRVEHMPPLDQEILVGEVWNFWEGSVSDLGLALYPICSHDFAMTKKIKMGTDFAVCQVCTAEGGTGKWVKFVQDGQNMEKSLDGSAHCVSRIIRSCRIELSDTKWKEKDTPIGIDGSVYYGGKIQGRFEESAVKHIF
jgi:hypothetical protein